MPVVAGVDSSTQSTTVVLRDADTGATLGSGRAPHSPTFPPVSEQHPHEWWDATVAAFAGARAAASVRPDDIVAVSVAAQCHGLVPLDAKGAVIRPAKLWNDTTAAAEIAGLTEQIGGDAWTDRIGTLPPPSFTIGKLAWLKAHEPENFAALATVLLPHDYLTWRLTGGAQGGRAVTDRSDASGTGYYSAPEGGYIISVLDLVDAGKDWPAMLPEVLDASAPAGTVPSAVAAELGVRTDAVVGAGAGDQHASAVGLGVGPGEFAYVLGTSGVVFTTSENPVFDHTGIVNSVADATGRYLPLICTLNAAKVTDTVARLLGVDHAALERLALAATDGAGLRPVLVSYLDGERTPNRPRSRGLLAGISSETSREELALAAFEGVVLGMERGQRRMQQMGIPLDGRLLVTGGGAASAAYRQVVADVTGRAVEVTDAQDAVAGGAAVQAAAVLRGADIRAVRDEWAPASRVVAEPSGRDYSRLRDTYTRAADWTGLDDAFND
ncbi:xylulokinase [Herbiconiux daphne]|uniref:Xylulose kinase n=1 Tax=Herbiconiux daphne TaxID=2970914 RepID=A0ABT2H5U4_9MICO|nr:xylulokinase [Herbiconiux daphne]MCS5735263.1 xylulokinase [Herbiconiux daphne]